MSETLVDKVVNAFADASKDMAAVFPAPAAEIEYV
jgi:hypothetical protein